MKEYKSTMPEITLKYKSGDVKKYQIKQSSDVFTIAKELLNLDTVELSEESLCLYLNKAHNTMGWTRISQGGIAGTIMDPRLIFQKAILCGASALILIHNHPSCNLKPSDQDIDITKKIKEGARYFEISLLEHLIIAGDLKKYYSFADEGIL